MGLDVALGPSSGFLAWTDQQWAEYNSATEPAPGDKLGSYGAISCTLETIRENSGGHDLKSEYPMFSRLAEFEGGWYLEELETLLAEIRSIRELLRTVPLNRIMLHERGRKYRRATEEDVRDMTKEFRIIFPDRTLENAEDFNQWILGTLEKFAALAKSQDRGLVLC